MAKSKANTRRTSARNGNGKGSASGASAQTAGASPETLAALHADPALVASAGIQCGMPVDEIDRRLIAAAAARAQS